MKCTGKNCPMQVGYDVAKCVATNCYYRTEPQTNADRIRAMSDEELAVLLSNTEANFPPNYPNGVSVKLCETAWLEWLKKEVDDG